MRLKFSELFADLEYSARCEELSGRQVEIAGYIAESHDGAARMLVAEPGGCPHCSPVPVVSLPDVKIKNGAAVTLRGRLSYGFKLDAAGNATMLRLENAKIATGLPT